MKYICPRCGGEGHLPIIMWVRLGSRFPHLRVEGLLRRRYFLTCTCPSCSERHLFRGSFEVELTRAQAEALELQLKRQDERPIGRVVD